MVYQAKSLSLNDTECEGCAVMERNYTILHSQSLLTDPAMTTGGRHFSVAVVLSAFAVATVWGNILVITSVICRPNLHTPTGYLVLSLAVADLIVGLGVMPLNVVFEMYNPIWLFGLIACDFWHSLDVLVSTASIWNLCVIAVDRCIAVSDPLKYHRLMNTRRVFACIALVWIGSSLIAFPAVAWWRIASPELYQYPDRCLFTDDTGYLIFSSLLSFYLPLLIIVAAYGRVYLIASRSQRSMLTGRQPLPSNPGIYIRVHRGRGKTVCESISSIDSSINIDRKPSELNRMHKVSIDVDSRTALREGQRRSYGSHPSIVAAPKISCSTPSMSTISARSSRSDSSMSQHSRRSRISAFSMGTSIDSGQRDSKRKKKPKTNLSIRLFAKESKAAKTLGIVVGAFIACWLPFFIVNILSGACGKRCELLSNETYRLTFTIVTWLGHCNSALNPLIYTCFNREFRDSFAYVLFCGRWTGRGRAYARRRQLHQALIQGQTIYAKKELAKVVESGLKVILPQTTNDPQILNSSTHASPLNEENEDELRWEEGGRDQNKLPDSVFSNACSRT